MSSMPNNIMPMPDWAKWGDYGQQTNVPMFSQGDTGGPLYGSGMTGLVTDPTSLYGSLGPSLPAFGDINSVGGSGMGGGFMDSMKSILGGAIGTKENPGWGGLALGGLNALMSMKQYGLAKNQLDFQKDSFNKQYEAQKGLTNSRLDDQRMARNASREGASTNPYASLKDYRIA